MQRTRQRLIVIVAAVAIIAGAGVWALLPGAPTSTPIGPDVPAAFRTMSGPYSATYDFITPSLGWALVVDYTTLSTRFFVFKTTDRATHWQKQYVGQAEGDVTHLHFFDARNGFLYAGLAYRSTDGGDHWQRVGVPGRDVSVTFASPTRGWAEVFDLEPSPRLYSTVDGGQTWTQVGAAPPSSELLQPVAEGGQTSGFRASGEGWLGAIHQPAPTVFVTADGGATWQTILLYATFGIDYYDAMVSLIPDTAVVAFLSDDSGRPLGASISSDGGASWTGLAFPPVGGVSSGELTFVDGDHWWLFDSGSVYTTDDAGRSWLYLHDIAFLSTSWRSISARAIDQKHAWWALTSTANSEIGALAMTSDGGEHWEMVNAPQP
jgi:photosystem II stability/assembly factor-like uncharacterized protein